MKDIIQNTKRDKKIKQHTWLLDEMSIIIAFFCAIIIRYNAIVNWIDYNLGIYVSMLATSILFNIVVYAAYDMNKPNIMVLDFLDNVLRVIKNRIFLIALLIAYFYATQRTVLASRIVMSIFLSLSVVFGLIFRMVYRRYHLSRYGAFGAQRGYRLILPATDIQAKLSEIKNGNYDYVLVITDSVEDANIRLVVKKIEMLGVRCYISLKCMGRRIKSELVIDVERNATIPAYVRTERTNIFGVNYCIAKTEEAVHHVLEHLEELRGQYICFSNVHTTVMAKEDHSYAEILNCASMVFPDGAPIAKIQSKRGFDFVERVAGPDFMENMFIDTMDGKVSHYFYGSTEKTLSHLRDQLQLKYPGLIIKGMYSPPFRQLTDEEDAEDVRRINESGADIVWVGLGAPKQEKWMNAHQGKVNAVMMGVGAGFDFHAGTIQRAPRWMRKIGMEWLYRLVKDPVRLFSRYIVTNIKFVLYLVSDCAHKGL